MSWLVAAIVALLLFKTRHELKALRQRHGALKALHQRDGEGDDDRTAGTTGGAADTPEPGLRVSRAMVVLRLQLLRMRDVGALAEEPYNEIVEKIDSYWAGGDPHAQPGSAAWWLSCEAGWNALTARGLMPGTQPPWRSQIEATPPPPSGPAPETTSPDAADHLTDAPAVAEEAQAPGDAAADPGPGRGQQVTPPPPSSVPETTSPDAADHLTDVPAVAEEAQAPGDAAAAPSPWRGQQVTPPPPSSVPEKTGPDPADHLTDAPAVAEEAQAPGDAAADPAPGSGQAVTPPPPSSVPATTSPGPADHVTDAPAEAEEAHAARDAAAGPAPVVAPAQPAARRREAEPAEASRAARAPDPRPVKAGAARTAAARVRNWRPVPPDALERALRSVARWPKVLLPFLVQSIGWFIGGFLFLAGSVFLVAYTSGFWQAAVVFASLYAYTVFLIWAGYKLLQARPRLTTASSVLLAIGMLLVPLTIAAATRLVLSAGDSVPYLIISVLGAVLCVGTFYFAAQVVSGVIHRSLRGAYSRLFIALAALQLAAVVVVEWPSWQVLGGLHLLLMGLLAYGLLRFAHEWLQSIFVDRKKIAFFAAGSLLYATLASFVHLTWGIDSAPLPLGYTAPYLMIVCGLLFYLDAQFKLHVHRAAFLSHFSFLVYGLSVVAVVLAMDAPVARLITLALAAALYAMVLWKYLTLIPLYLMLASGCGLYADTLLTYIPARAHLLLALPGLYGLSVLSRWAARRGAQKPSTNAQGLARVALVTYRASLLLLTLVAAWSLVDGRPGLLAVSTGLVFAAALAWLLRAAPGPILTAAKTSAELGRPINLLLGPWLYAPIVALTGSVALAPVLFSQWAPQFSISLAALGCLWTGLLLYRRKREGPGKTAQVEVYVNSTLLSLTASVALAAALAVQPTMPWVLLIGVLWLSAAMLLTLSLNLYVRWLFYAFLLVAAAAAAATKLTYFPQPSVGLTEMFGVAALWALLWWLDRQPDELSEIARRRAWRDAPARLLWWLAGAERGIDAAGLAEPIGGARASEAAPAATGISDR